MKKKVPWELRPVWDSLLAIYVQIRQICERHGLRHWAIGGTALGAVRHGGFIPWDDDLDIALLRPDYDRFISFAKEELPSSFQWHSIETDPDWALQYGKVYDVRIDQVERVQKMSGLSFPEGLFVDVFPVDGQPSTDWGLLLFKAVRGRWWQLLSLLPLSNQRRRSLYDRYLAHIPLSASRKCGVANADTWRQKRCCWPREWFDGATDFDFEGLKVPLPADGVEFLDCHYRNWRALPPEDCRVPSHQRLPGGIVDC